MPRKKKPEFKWPPEIEAIWRNSPQLTLCPKFRRAGVDKVVAHIRKDKCERCLAVWRQLESEWSLIRFLRRSRN